ncbi:NUDIX hydrolase [Parafrankia colletiae]|uniref:NUDIX hydrolase n=1 Tax=Parafrankia colletiae TaxID=573497 RepID=A0A1S1Q5K4_9ACTN|nr:NUDIX hydrolase [Parafrankia colletiae]MCK9902252.1 NUDIX hydrolase [Frankia sp. Cpl3]OHV29220.1 NUDIX hydrolase [Parafrankia colletiae]
MVDHQAALITRFTTSRQVDPEEAAVLARLAAAPAAPRDAATVILLRDAPAGPGVEAYMLRRITAMSFAGGMYAFPGGRVDPADGDAALPWAGPPVEAVLPGLDRDPVLARALVSAAVRETFEECGVLLAEPAAADDDAADDNDADDNDAPASASAEGAAPVPAAHDLEADRLALENRRLGLAELLTRRSLALRADRLAAWARWIAPELEPRRYDTRFFVAALPPGQQPGPVSGEADQVMWVRPADALARFAARELAMLPPTAFTLAELAAFDDVAAVLAAARSRDLTPVQPVISVAGGRWQLLFPHADRGTDRGTGAR